jgi:hypothetical protein
LAAFNDTFRGNFKIFREIVFSQSLEPDGVFSQSLEPEIIFKVYAKNNRFLLKKMTWLRFEPMTILNFRPNSCLNQYATNFAIKFRPSLTANLNWCDEWYKYKYGGATLEDPHLRTDN